MYKKVALIVCLLILLALALPAEGRKHKKERENGGKDRIMYNNHGKGGEHVEYEKGHGKEEEYGKGHGNDEKHGEWKHEKQGEWKGEKHGEWKHEKQGEWKGEKHGEWKHEKHGEWKGEKHGEWKEGQHKEWNHENHEEWKQGEGQHGEWKHEKGEKHGEWKHGGKGGYHHKGEGHHWREHSRFRHANLTIHFVEESLSPSVYLLLEDNGIQVKAAYEMLGNSTALTKVGIKVSGKSIIVSANGNLAIDGQEYPFSEFESVEFDNGKLKKKHNSLILKFDVYRIFMKMHHGRMHKAEEERNEVPRIRMVVGVKKDSKVRPTGFIGDRISVDPLKYVTTETIA